MGNIKLTDYNSYLNHILVVPEPELDCLHACSAVLWEKLGSSVWSLQSHVLYMQHSTLSLCIYRLSTIHVFCSVFLCIEAYDPDAWCQALHWNVKKWVQIWPISILNLGRRGSGSAWTPNVQFSLTGSESACDFWSAISLEGFSGIWTHKSHFRVSFVLEGRLKDGEDMLLWS